MVEEEYFIPLGLSMKQKNHLGLEPILHQCAINFLEKAGFG